MAPAPPPAPAPAPAPSPAETLPAPPPESAPTPPPAETTPTPPAEDAAPEAAEAPAEEAAAEPAADEAAAEPPPEPHPEPHPEQEATEPVAYRVTEEQWQAALEQSVTVERDGGEPIHGKLVATTEAAAVIVADDGDVHTLRKADVAVVTIDDAPEAAEPEAVSEQNPPAEEASDPPAKKEDDWKKFGVFTSHGISYAHWRTEPYQAGAAAYAGDLGVGYNWRRAWGAYLVLGGHAGARLVRRTIKGNFGHLAGMVRYRGKKRFVAMGGLALAWSKLDEPERRVRDVAVSIPLKIMAQFKVADSLYLAMGVGYEPGFFAQGRIANALSLQATLAHW